MIRGVPKEIMQGEARVAATTETVENFRKVGLLFYNCSNNIDESILFSFHLVLDKV